MNASQRNTGSIKKQGTQNQSGKKIPEAKFGLSPAEIKQYENICQLTNSFFFAIEIDTDLFYGSPGTYELLGAGSEEGINTFSSLLDDCLVPENKDALLEKLKKYVEDPGLEPFRFDLDIKDKSILLKDHKLSLSAKISEENRKLILGVLEEVRSNKKLEDELNKLILKAKQADNFRLNFLKNLSYEIRTPMNTILGFSELLTQSGITEKEIAEYTNLIRNKGRYLHSLIDDVIEISQFESGKINFNKSIVKVQPILNELFEEFETRRENLKKDSVTFVMFVPENSENQVIYADAGRLHQLLSNLLSNALKFTQRGRIEFGYKLGEKYIKFYVSDTGPGLTKEDKKKIFNRFEELEETSIRKYSGTGLSLTISKYIVKQMGGKIKVKSELNKGSKFQISIPVVIPPDIESNNEWVIPKIEEVDWKDKVILIAEDEEVNFRFLEVLILRTNAKVLRAKNGQEAVDLCRNISKIDLVLMDIKMPVMSGYDAIIAIKRIRTNLPIIVQTALGAHAEMVKCQNLGSDDFVSKPIDINLLIKKIERQFNR